VLPKPFSRGALGAYVLSDTVYWDTLAPRIAEIGCHSVIRDGPGSPDKARIHGSGR
jgi:hypothetical protein